MDRAEDEAVAGQGSLAVHRGHHCGGVLHLLPLRVPQGVGDGSSGTWWVRKPGGGGRGAGTPGEETGRDWRTATTLTNMSFAGGCQTV